MTRKIIAIIAWLLFGAITIGTLFQLLTSRGNLGADQNYFVLAGDLAWAMVPIEFAFLSAMIVSRQPGNVIGWLLMLPAIALGGDLLDIIFNFAAVPAAPTPAFMVALWFSSWSWLLLIFPILFIILLFPTGRPATSRWRWAVLYLLGVNIMFFLIIAFGKSLSPADGSWSVVNPVGFIPNNLDEGFLTFLIGFGLLSATLLCAISMVAR